MKEPLVSICVPNYNKEEHIGELIQSILAQTYTNFELIIVDNASTDNSMEVINSFSDPRIKVYRNDRNIGAVANGNKSMGYAKGDYIALFHSDDIYHKQIVEAEVKALSKIEDAGMASTMEAKDLDEFKRRQNENLESDGYFYDSLNFTKLLFSGITVVNVSVMMKRKCYEEMGDLATDCVEAIDQLYYLHIASRYGLFIVKNELVFKRGHKTEHTLEYNRHWIDDYDALKRVAKEIYDTSTHKEELKTLYTYFIATQDRNSCRRSLVIEDYEGARKYLLRFLHNMVKTTSDEKLIQWIIASDKLAKTLYSDEV